jgi:hypothetical protein
MTKLKAQSAVIILSAAITTPLFAQDAGVRGPGSHYGFEQKHRGAYNQQNRPFNATSRTRDSWNFENFGSSERDPSRPGGEDPSLKQPSS